MTTRFLANLRTPNDIKDLSIAYFDAFSSLKFDAGSLKSCPSMAAIWLPT